MNTDDWPTTVAKYREIFGKCRLGKNAWALFKGSNFMTDEVLGYVDVDGTAVEISTGWFLDHRIFGVTFPNQDGPDTERSRMVESLEEAYDHLYGDED